MNNKMKQYYQKILTDLRHLIEQNNSYYKDTLPQHSVKDHIEKQISTIEEKYRERLTNEFLKLGPLETLINDLEVEEIFLNGDGHVYLNQGGQNTIHNLTFLGPETQSRIFETLLKEAAINLTYEVPFADGEWKGFRIHAARPPVSRQFSITLRRMGKAKQHDYHQFAPTQILQKILSLAQEKANILIVGPTGSGKTSFLNHLLSFAGSFERCISLEETPEIELPNPLSHRLLTVKHRHGSLKSIDLNDLLKEVLRMRPDRIILGEIRSVEAKDYLMALSTGHRGCLSTLHSRSSREALIRLEMLIQLGAPQWKAASIHALISLALDAIIVIGFTPKGQRCIREFSVIEGCDQNGSLLNSIYSITDNHTAFDMENNHNTNQFPSPPYPSGKHGSLDC